MFDRNRCYLYSVACHLNRDEAENAAQNDEGGDNEAHLYVQYINDELNDAAKYHELWLKTGDDQFKEIAMDEVKHSEILIKLAREIGMVPEAELQSLIMWHHSLLAKL